MFINRFKWSAAGLVIIPALIFSGSTYSLVYETSETAGDVFAVKPVSEKMSETEDETEPEPETAPEKVKEKTTSIERAIPEGFDIGKSNKVEFTTVLQNPELPTGCEITALTQTLNHYGFNVDKVTMADVFMAKDPIGYFTMNDAYIGDPHADNGFGCNAPVIVRAANEYFDYIGSDWSAFDLTGAPLEEIFYQIDLKRPVVIWTTMYQYETVAEFQFELGCGENFYFNPCQHCVTIFGFDYTDNTVHVADPLVGNVKYDMERFRRIYETMGRQAVALNGDPETAGKDYTTPEEKKAWLKKNRPAAEENTTTTTTTTTTATTETTTATSTETTAVPETEPETDSVIEVEVPEEEPHEEPGEEA